MKTWEMIKELTENPHKKFSYNDGETYVVIESGIVIWRGEYQKGQGFAIGNTIVDREWEEVKEPVGFMEAVKSGKKIRVEHKLVKEADIAGLYDLRSLDMSLYLLAQEFDADEVRDIIVNGKWYVE